MPFIELKSSFKLHFLHWESNQSPFPIVLLHGLASNAHIWDLVAPILHNKQYELFAIDQRGHGLSDKPQSGYDFHTITKDLFSALTLLKAQHPVLIGHSWGAHVAVHFAARYKNSAFAPRGLILVDGGVVQMQDMPGATWESMLERLRPPKLAGMPLDDFKRNIRTWTNGLANDERILNIILNNIEVHENNTISPHLAYENHIKILHSIWNSRLDTLYKEIRSPAAAILAQPEKLSEQEAAFLTLKKKGIGKILRVKPDLEVTWLLDTIHDIPLQRPQKLAQLILDFVSNLEE